MWNVVAGLHTNSAFSLSFEQIIELTRLLVSQVKALLPNTRHAPHREATQATLRAIADFTNHLLRDHREGDLAAHAAE